MPGTFERLTQMEDRSLGTVLEPCASPRCLSLRVSCLLAGGAPALYPTLTMACCTVDAESTAKESGLNPLKSGTKTKDLLFELFCSGILLQQHKADQHSLE